MNPLEPLALGLAAVRRGLGEFRSPPLARGWALLAAAATAAVLALAWAAHPAVSWALAPLLERSGLEGVLRYPAHMEQLPALTRRLVETLRATVVPVLAGLTMMAAHARWNGLPAPTRAASLRRAPAYLVVMLPVLLAAAALRAALPLLDEVRLSSLTRAAIPPAAGVLTVALYASWAWMLPRVAIGRLGVADAWREWPRQMARGFAPALVVSALMAAAMLPAERLLDTAPQWVRTGWPDAVIACALVEVAAVVGTGWLSAVAMALLHEAVPMDEDRS